MRLTIMRSGLSESTHDVDVCAIDASGTELLASGDPEHPIHYRSTVKPFQATIGLEAGLSVPSEHLALVCASHSGWPVQLATVSAILESAGLDERALQTPPSWPLAEGARFLRQRRGDPRPRSIYHNCSGKHAGMLAASAASGWATETYLAPDHPLHTRLADLISELTQVPAVPVGVDHCGAPATRGSVRGLARAYAALTTDERFATAAAVAIAADRLGLVSDAMRAGLAAVMEPVVFGGGRPVGVMTSA